MSDIDLSKLNFGALAAERDAALSAYFVASESYKRLRDGKRSVILGPRGSGKSAIFRMIARDERDSGAVVIELAPEDYSYELLKQTLLPEKQGSWAKQGAYTAAWKYLLYVKAMKELASSKGLKTGDAREIYEYIRDNHDDFDKNPIATLISYLKRLEGFKIGSYEAGLKTRELQRLYRLAEIEPLLPHLDALAKKRRVVILVDELDRGWDASEDAIAFVAGLFQAAVTLKTNTPNLQVLSSLRKELYDNIPALYEDAQKVRDVMESLEWDEPRLLQMIAKRIAHSLSCSEETSEKIWNLIFAETLDYRKNKSFNYMVDRTLYRPRELIQFCTDTVNCALDRKEAAPLNYAVISEAEHRYSEERLKDIAAEFRFQYPGLISVFETFRGMTYTLSRNDLELHCLAIITGEQHVDSLATKWCSNMDPEDLIEVLWRIGFIRGQAVGGQKARRRSGSRYLGSHQVAILNLRNLSRFHVHPMFRSYLGMKESKAEQ